MADLRITHVSVLLEDGTILKDQNVDVTGGHFSRTGRGRFFCERSLCRCQSGDRNICPERRRHCS